MKRQLLCFAALTSIIYSAAQNVTIDRLKQKLRTEVTDIDKCKTLDSLSMYNMFFYHNQDSTLYYCNECINRAFNLPDKKYLILAYARLSFYYNNTGQYKESLSTALRGLDLSEQFHIADYLSTTYYDLTWVYRNFYDNAGALKSALTGVSFLKQNKDPFFDQDLHLYGILGDCYILTGHQDSAIYYYKKMDS